jgi:hypothetical protein
MIEGLGTFAKSRRGRPKPEKPEMGELGQKELGIQLSGLGRLGDFGQLATGYPTKKRGDSFTPY